MRVLIACEFSAIVRDAFRGRGHDAWSCDLLACEGDPRWHIQADHDLHLLDVMVEQYWDLIIAHPPCTYLANSGVRWLFGGKGQKRDPERWELMRRGAAFFKSMLMAPALRVAVENPIPHKYAMEEIARLLGSTPKSEKYNQIVQPWQFGVPETKATCLWLSNLPALVPTQIVSGRTPKVHYESPGPERMKNRSRSCVGIAEAMADQWGSL